MHETWGSLPWATSSRLVVDHELSTMPVCVTGVVWDDVTPVPVACAARAVASSPSVCAIRCMADGAMQMGDGTVRPSTLVRVSSRLTSTSTRGMMRNLMHAFLIGGSSRAAHRWNARRFSDSVSWSLAPDA